MLQLLCPHGTPGQELMLRTESQGPLRCTIGDGTPFQEQGLGWDGQNPLLLTVAPAGHPAGIYMIAGTYTVRVDGGVGTVLRNIYYSDVGPKAIMGTQPMGVSPGPWSNDLLTIVSDGVDPIIVEFVPGAVDPAAEIDVVASATIIGHAPTP